ncbi:uncharacterized protein LOC124440942 isoform X2 [Xenia sp. Carnegie-2017]|uniref:uncharacterized protein LOC124440942 isoform X2 n=1 Tax=Xenia sp. Carnegie-2017 TaxID=2897299 RepID=UPI001F03A389|nr:uncharacterized protein LOC124440942 isoform X2 [Xenia sp. Carnegie-2017]
MKSVNLRSMGIAQNKTQLNVESMDTCTIFTSENDYLENVEEEDMSLCSLRSNEENKNIRNSTALIHESTLNEDFIPNDISCIEGQNESIYLPGICYTGSFVKFHGQTSKLKKRVRFDEKSPKLKTTDEKEETAENPRDITPESNEFPKDKMSSLKRQRRLVFKNSSETVPACCLLDLEETKNKKKCLTWFGKTPLVVTLEESETFPTDILLT